MDSLQKTVLVVDGGGRGSALVNKYLQSPSVKMVLAAPGNDLMKENVKKPIKTFPKIKTTDKSDIIKICKIYKVDLIDVCQDDAIAVGVVDALKALNFKAFGPTQTASQIEWDKAWARGFMKKFKIPSPEFNICHSQKDGTNFIKSQREGEWFIKAAGLAAGKGVLYAANNKEALLKIRDMKNFGKSGETFVIEKCLHGEEFSAFALVDSKDFKILGYAQDHKRAFNNDLGPNTGGMGCSSPPMVITSKIKNQIKIIFKKTVESLVKLKRPYVGILYLGGMIDEKGKVYVIEFNARWGDPEAQVIIPSVKNDFYELAEQVLDGKLSSVKIKTDKKYRVVVTAASKGYPSDYSQALGKQIFGLEKLLKLKGVRLFSGATKKTGKKLLTSGTRLFYVMAEGKNVAEARQKAYNALSLVSVEGNNLHYRQDIGWRDLARIKSDYRET